MALKWFNLAAAQVDSEELGARPAMKALEEIAFLMTPDQIAEGQRLAREWKPKK
jgi:hypothetical protein